MNGVRGVSQGHGRDGSQKNRVKSEQEILGELGQTHPHSGLIKFNR
jgi:hypothetical protein